MDEAAVERAGARGTSGVVDLLQSRASRRDGEPQHRLDKAGLAPGAALRQSRDGLAQQAASAGSWSTHREKTKADAAQPLDGGSSCEQETAPTPSLEWVTHQHCHMAGDESEMCVYQNAACFDGETFLVFVPGSQMRSQIDHRTWYVCSHYRPWLMRSRRSASNHDALTAAAR